MSELRPVSAVQKWAMGVAVAVTATFSVGAYNTMRDVRDSTLTLTLEVGYLRRELEALRQDRVTASQVRDALALRDQRLGTVESRVTALEEAERARAVARRR